MTASTVLKTSKFNMRSNYRWNAPVDNVIDGFHFANERT
jgi:hypothetical protein